MNHSVFRDPFLVTGTGLLVAVIRMVTGGMGKNGDGSSSVTPLFLCVFGLTWFGGLVFWELSA